MGISHLFALVICVKVTTGESICMRRLCEDTLYNIKIHRHVHFHIFSKGSKNQCPMSTRIISQMVTKSKKKPQKCRAHAKRTTASYREQIRIILDGQELKDCENLFIDE
uniref:C2H2-type domain-containing protein n=1 Tax=Romanomermis culicivorax TaxID=13658 RepID=A0A915KG87_ROMCU